MKENNDNLANQSNDSKRSDNSNQNDSKRSNKSNSPKEEDLNKISNRSQDGSDNVKKIEDNSEDYNETNRTLPEKPSFFNKLCGYTNNKKDGLTLINEEDDKKEGLITILNEYLVLNELKEKLEGIKQKQKDQLINKYKEYIDRFENSNEGDGNKKINKETTLLSKILNYSKVLLKTNNKYDDIKKDIMLIYHTVYHQGENGDSDFSFNANDNDISQIDINDNDISQIGFSRNNTNMSDNQLRLDLSELTNEVNEKEEIDNDKPVKKNDSKSNEKEEIEKIDEEGYGTVIYKNCQRIKDLVTTKANNYFKSKNNTIESSQEYKELRKKFDSLQDNDEFVNTKGGTVEGSPINLEINQDILTNTQPDNEEFIDDSNGYSCYQYAGTAIAICIIAQALHYMSQMGDHDYHGFGPSGF